MGVMHPHRSTVYICFEMSTRVTKLSLTENVSIQIHAIPRLYLADVSVMWPTKLNAGPVNYCVCISICRLVWLKIKNYYEEAPSVLLLDPMDADGELHACRPGFRRGRNGRTRNSAALSTDLSNVDGPEQDLCDGTWARFMQCLHNILPRRSSQEHENGWTEQGVAAGNYEDPMSVGPGRRRSQRPGR
jgi:hypothetical protein